MEEAAESAEEIRKAKEELKRADHLIYVSLKYTRTVDVIKSVIDRLIGSFSHGVNAIMIYSEEKRLISTKESSPVAKAELAKTVFSDKERFNELVDLYLLLRKVSRAKYTSEREYRRHVTMTADVEGQKIEVHINRVYELYEDAKIFVNMCQNIVEEREDDANE